MWKVTGCRPVRLLYKDEVRDDRTPPPDQYEVERLLNGGVGMIFHIGHGSETSWDGCLDLVRLARIGNGDLPPVMFSIGPTTARYAPLPPSSPYLDATGKAHKGLDDGEQFAGPAPPPANDQRGAAYPTGLGVEFVRAGPNGAVAYIGSATGSKGYAWVLIDGFLDYYTSYAEPRLGDVWRAALAHYHGAYGLEKPEAKDSYQVEILAQELSFRLFGDPSMRLPQVSEPGGQPAGQRELRGQPFAIRRGRSGCRELSSSERRLDRDRRLDGDPRPDRLSGVLPAAGRRPPEP